MTGRYWRDDAACRLADARLFGPPSGDERQPGQFETRRDRAVAICAACPVTAECLAEAARNEDDGIFGGLVLQNGKPTSRLRPGRPPKETAA